MKLIEIFNKNTIEILDNVSSKNDLISRLIENVDGSKINDKSKALDDVLAREKVMSTGVGKGIALPHAKTQAVEDICGSLILLNQPVDFNSLDNKPIRLSCLLLSKITNIGLHLKMLSSLSKLLNNDSIRNNIFNCNNTLEIYNIIEDFESEIVTN